jgi:hypothetical protein
VALCQRACDTLGLGWTFASNHEGAIDALKPGAPKRK